MSKRSTSFNFLMLVFICVLAYTTYTFYTGITKPEQKASKTVSQPTKILLDSGQKKAPINTSKTKTSVPERMSNDSGENETAKALGIDKEQYQVMKEDYFCDLAETARENCELQERSEESMEICLKMGSYFTNSRHCGYQP